jgi:hypothetical protein
MNKPIRNDAGGMKYTTLSQAAKALGHKGGKTTSIPKAAAARANGALGGKPSSVSTEKK